MVLRDGFQEIKPEQRELREHATFVGNAGGQHIIEGRDAVGGDEQQMLVVHAIDVSHLAAGVQLQFGKISLQQDRIFDLCRHREKNYSKSVAHSKRPPTFVNVTNWSL